MAIQVEAVAILNLKQWEGVFGSGIRPNLYPGLHQDLAPRRAERREARDGPRHSVRWNLMRAPASRKYHDHILAPAPSGLLSSLDSRHFDELYSHSVQATSWLLPASSLQHGLIQLSLLAVQPWSERHKLDAASGHTIATLLTILSEKHMVQHKNHSS